MAEGFCTKCGIEIESFDGLKCCPGCNTQDVPCAYSNQHNVSINVHELRILCMWTEFWVNSVKDEQMQAGMAHTLRSIAQRLLKQLPQGTALLFSDELSQVKKHYDVESNILPI